MTKKDIAIMISDQIGEKQILVKKIVQKTLDTIVDILAKGETIELRNFGVFKVKSRKGRIGRNPRTNETVPVPPRKIGRNPRTNETVPVPPRKVVVFKPGLVMKRKVK